MRRIILIQIGRTFREDMSSLALYEATCGSWRIGAAREETEYAMAVAGGIIREVYRIEQWHEAGTHKYETRDQDEVAVEGRWEFSGRVAEDAVRDKYVGCKIGKLGQSPIRYLSDFNDLDAFIQSNTSVQQNNSQEGAKNMTDDALEVLKQIRQIIFYGPPGTGKTYRAKEILKELFSEESAELEELQGDRWNIVQFHPSYNYEDFVRGIKVETSGSGDKSHVVYKTVNRIFGKMCDVAEKNPDRDYVLIVDEINRANVSAVLGELIYALEYRDEPVNTPYEVSGEQDIIIPKNLYIIGTMNSADRTIGQIDYAVRRRFAFVHCPPDKSVIAGQEAHKFFDDVDAIFTKHISQDYDADDVRIGHSYFLASGMELANKMIYQVIPILREYVKDGVLKKDAVSEIDAIERFALVKEDINNETI